MPQTATIENLPEAFEVVKAMPAENRLQVCTAWTFLRQRSGTFCFYHWFCGRNVLGYTGSHRS